MLSVLVWHKLITLCGKRVITVSNDEAGFHLIVDDHVDGFFVLLVDERFDRRPDALDTQQLQLVLILRLREVLTNQILH